ncbi:MAG TPA: DNA-directed RNA polymerase subunit omega [Methylomirabilota bacterium]|nr:DNA-directed RNA polymerase subunit omega [Methylomirabilota bacterium]
MIQLPEGFDSIFRYIVVVSQRAEQLVNGAKQRSDSRHDKPTLVAIDDVDEGLVEWRVLTQEELDAQRQAIVDQLRAEVGVTDGELPTSVPIPDVLPTAASGGRRPVGAAEAGERDDELLRLQKLLGMAGAMDDEDLGDEDEDEGEDVADLEDEPETIDLDEAADELEGDDDDDDED